MTQPTQDAHDSLEALARLLREASLTVLWRQWRALGGQTAAKVHAHSMVDPEALVLLSLTLMTDEKRLVDVVHDWAMLNSGLLSVQRTNNLAASYPEVTRERLWWFGRVASKKGKDQRWRTLAAHASTTDASQFESPSPRADKARAIRARLADPATLLLRLRLGLGVGAKADVLSYLLGNAGEHATVREIATATAYTVAAVRRAAEDMAAARLIHVSVGSPAGYRVDRASWSEVLGLSDGLPPWRSWHERFAFVAAFLNWVEVTAGRPMTRYAAGVKGREVLEKHRTAFNRDLVTVWSEHTPVADWAVFVEGAVRSLARWMVESA